MNEPTVLTREHIKFLRAAMKNVVFRYRNERATLEAQANNGAELVLDCAISCMFYGNRPAWNARTGLLPHSAFEMIHTPSFTYTWLTVLSFLRSGDTVELHFMADLYRENYARDKDGEALHMDVLEMRVHRGSKFYAFNLHASVCANNTARMIQFTPAQLSCTCDANEDSVKDCARHGAK